MRQYGEIELVSNKEKLKKFYGTYLDDEIKNAINEGKIKDETYPFFFNDKNEKDYILRKFTMKGWIDVTEQSTLEETKLSLVLQEFKHQEVYIFKKDTIMILSKKGSEIVHLLFSDILLENNTILIYNNISFKINIKSTIYDYIKFINLEILDLLTSKNFKSYDLKVFKRQDKDNFKYRFEIIISYLENKQINGLKINYIRFKNTIIKSLDINIHEQENINTIKNIIENFIIESKISNKNIDRWTNKEI